MTDRPERRPLRTVMVGFGMVADGFADDPLMARYFNYATHAQVLADHPRFDWLAVVDPSEEARARAANRWGVRHCVGHVDDLPSSLAPEVAVIATPPHHRRGLIERWPSLRAAMVEKPLAPTLEQADSFIADCGNRGVVVQVHFWRRGVAALRDLAGGGLSALIGRPQAAFGVYGGGLLNNGVHLIDLARWLLGEVSEARVTGAVSRPDDLPLPGDAQVPFCLAFPEGTVFAAAPVDFRHYREVGLDIWGTEGRLSLLHETLTMHHFPKSPNRGVTGADEISSDRPAVSALSVGNALYALYDDLLDAVDTGRAPVSEGMSALATQKIASALTETGEAAPRR